MARAKKDDTPSLALDVEPAEVAAIEGAAESFRLDPALAVGDCRDAMLQVIRRAANWSSFNENQQRDINAAVHNAATTIVSKITKALADEGHEVVYATVESVNIKEKIKIVLTGPVDIASLSTLAENQGREVHLVFPNVARFAGQRADAPVEPDQGVLIPKGPEGDTDLVDAADPEEAVEFEIEDEAPVEVEEA